MGEFNLGERILYYLDIKQMNQKEFAKLCNVTESTMTRYIKGEREPKCTTLMNMAYVLGVSLDDLTNYNNYLIQKYTKEL